MRTAILFMMLMLAAHAAAGEPTAKSKDLVTVRTYNYASVRPEDLSDAQFETDRIFGRARIAVDWIECRVPGSGAGAPCTEPLLAGRDLMLRLMERAPAGKARSITLGESMLDREQRSGVLMTIDVWPVRTVAGQSATPMPTLLGRAIAHEIGHLLLGSGQHPRLGLMRAHWSNDELRGLKPAHWGFSSREAAHMRQTLRGKSRVAD
jgi:hypothetical protein